MSKARTMAGGVADRGTLPVGEHGRALCRWCSLEVPPRRFTFCSDFCVEEWRLRTDPGHLRTRVEERDRGICALCGLDCIAEYSRLRRLRGLRRSEEFQRWGIRFGPRARKSLWDADHIVAVAQGGGECDLSNLRTLCLKCHRSRHAATSVRALPLAGS